MAECQEIKLRRELVRPIKLWMRRPVSYTHLSLQQIIEKKTVQSQPLHLVFIDFEKAYDNVPLANLRTALNKLV